MARAAGPDSRLVENAERPANFLSKTGFSKESGSQHCNPEMDQELVSLLSSSDRDAATKGAEMLASFLSSASFPSKSVQALREVLPTQQLQRIFSALSQRLVKEVSRTSDMSRRAFGFN